MGSSEVQLLANPSWTFALPRSSVQTAARGWGLRTTGKTEEIAKRVQEEAARRLAGASEALEEWTLAEAPESIGGHATGQGSLRQRLQRSMSSAKLSRASAMKVDEPTEHGIRMVSPRVRPMASNDSLMRDLANTAPQQPPFSPSTAPIYEFGSPAQLSPTREDFAKATSAVLQELQSRTGTTYNEPLHYRTSGPMPPATKGRVPDAKHAAQAGLGLRYEAAHQKAFEAMDSITTHHSLGRFASRNKRINSLVRDDIDDVAPPVPPLRLPNNNGKRVISTHSLQNIVGPAVKRMRVASQALVQPTDQDARLSEGLRLEGWCGMPPTQEEVAMAARQNERRLQRQLQQGKRASPRKSQNTYATATGRSEQTKPLPALPVTTPLAAPLGQATAARAASRTLHSTSGTSRIPRTSDVGTKGVLQPRTLLLNGQDHDPPSLRSDSDSVDKAKVQSANAAAPRIKRAEIQRRVHARMQMHKETTTEHAVGHLFKKYSPLKSHVKIASPGKNRSSLSRRAAL